jgi:hypothetical protein
LSAKGTSGSTLTCKAMANRHSDRISSDPGRELAATARRDSKCHGDVLLAPIGRFIERVRSHNSVDFLIESRPDVGETLPGNNTIRLAPREPWIAQAM